MSQKESSRAVPERSLISKQCNRDRKILAHRNFYDVVFCFPDLFAEKAAFYDISDKIIEDAEKIYGFKVTKDALQDCLDTANGTKSE